MRFHIVTSSGGQHSDEKLAGAEAVPAKWADLVQWLEGEGAVVSQSEPVPLDADLYLFATGHPAMKTLKQGLVVLDLRHDPGLEGAPWAPYADLCLVRDAEHQFAMVRVHDCEPERVFVVPDDHNLRSLVRDALRGTLAPAQYEKEEVLMDERHTVSASMPSSNVSSAAVLAARLQEARRRADVVQRDYQVRSRIPLVGPLVSWVRRNLTSHLREPYLDPALDRQVAFNRELLAILQEMQISLTNVEARLAQLEGEPDHE